MKTGNYITAVITGAKAGPPAVAVRSVVIAFIKSAIKVLRNHCLCRTGRQPPFAQLVHMRNQSSCSPPIPPTICWASADILADIVAVKLRRLRSGENDPRVVPSVGALGVALYSKL